MQRQNWLITGVSTGLGRAFAQAALSAGHTVVGTVRSENDVRAFEELGPGHAHGRILDVTDGGAVNGVVAEVERSVGPLDVVVANAGYGLEEPSRKPRWPRCGGSSTSTCSGRWPPCKRRCPTCARAAADT